MFVDELFIDATREQADFKFEPFHKWADTNDADWCRFYRLDNDYLLRFPNLADFKIDSEKFCRPMLACAQCGNGDNKTNLPEPGGPPGSKP